MNTARPGVGKARKRTAGAVSRRILDDLCPNCAPLSGWRPFLDLISRICWLFGSSIDTELRFPKARFQSVSTRFSALLFVSAR